MQMTGRAAALDHHAPLGADCAMGWPCGIQGNAKVSNMLDVVDCCVRSALIVPRPYRPRTGAIVTCHDPRRIESPVGPCYPFPLQAHISQINVPPLSLSLLFFRSASSVAVVQRHRPSPPQPASDGCSALTHPLLASRRGGAQPRSRRDQRQHAGRFFLINNL